MLLTECLEVFCPHDFRLDRFLTRSIAVVASLSHFRRRQGKLLKDHHQRFVLVCLGGLMQRLYISWRYGKAVDS